MFNAKNLVLIAFVLWSGICWSWYVCAIKDQCWPTGGLIDAEMQDVSPEPQATAPAEEETYNPPPPSNISTNEADLVKVQVYEGTNLLVIHFPYNSTQKEADKAVDGYLKRLADQVTSSGKRVNINGHTDFVGEEQNNLDIAQKRAENIRNVLVKKGVPAGQISCRSFGESRPAATNDTPEGRYQNRRVEILVSE
ncbi:MAG: OmpA family protein [Saprospiraceae bacterium]|nr:OmpA family protein [Saprospiraceae bacterium]